jgi:HD-GYP domain-containing protein (c-di-GMP phosphodiesterase class II)
LRVYGIPADTSVRTDLSQKEPPPMRSPAIPDTHDLFTRLEQLNRVGVSLSREKDLDRLLETILVAAKEITNADGGTLYRMTEERALKFEIMRNDTFNIAMGGTTGVEIPLYPIALYDRDGKPNLSMVAAYAALHDQSVNVEDAYTAEGFDFSGTRNIDSKTGYRSKSFLTIPMKNHENEIIGVLQLINAAIDDKSPYTGGHCQRVPTLTMMLAEAVNDTQCGPLKDFEMTDEDRYELKIAGLLHDCGKVTTPVHVVDKATKLQTIFDRIELLDTRFEVLKRDAEIAALRAQLSALGHDALPRPDGDALAARLAQINADREFLHVANLGVEAMSEDDQQRVRQIAATYRWRDPDGASGDALTADEVENLTIRAGTLTTAERQIINHHIEVTIQMLESLPWPRHLKNVPEYAGGHHERMDGKGYPRGLTRDQMSVQARVMGIADIFEALTARDRPYKKGKTLTESLMILGRMKLDGHIDPDLFDIFMWHKIYQKYAEQSLDPEQIDDVDVTKIPGYVPPPEK